MSDVPQPPQAIRSGALPPHPRNHATLGAGKATPHAQQLKEVAALSRRDFLRTAAQAAAGTAMTVALLRVPSANAAEGADGTIPGINYDPSDHLFAYVIDTRKCIGCGMCVQACSRENKVPDNFYRTWIERYTISESGEAEVESPQGGINGFKPIATDIKVTKAYFMPKMCNHCENTPCSQVCPVGASYTNKDGVVLVDSKRCIGCGYCVQACPFGSRFINPTTHTADKCTWCYHRVTKGMTPACVQACPTGTRLFGDLKKENDPIRKIISEERVAVLQPEKLTKPRCYYLGYDKEMR